MKAEKFILYKKEHISFLLKLMGYVLILAYLLSVLSGFYIVSEEYFYFWEGLLFILSYQLGITLFFGLLYSFLGFLYKQNLSQDNNSLM